MELVPKQRGCGSCWVGEREVEWTGSGGFPVYVQTAKPIPPRTSFFVFQIQLQTGHCELGLGQALGNSADRNVLLLFSTKLGVLVEPNNSTKVQIQCQAQDEVSCGVRFGALHSFMFVARNGNVVYTLPWVPVEEGKEVFAFCVANPSDSVQVRIGYALNESAGQFEELERAMDWYLEEQTRRLSLSTAITMGLEDRVAKCDEICLDFFRHHGYACALRAMSQGEVNEGDIQEVARRSAVCGMVRDGEFALAVDALHASWPLLVESLDCDVVMQVRLLHFKAILLDDRDDSAAIAFAQQHIWPYSQQAGRIGQAAKQALLLFAGGGGGDIGKHTSDWAHERHALASELNQALLQLAGHNPQPLLKRLVAHCELEGEELRRQSTGSGQLGQPFTLQQLLL
ncbi:hypothetical protein BASA81_000302 [Batrachochytrium salamandrivorans]|nr:hypothetical protein BASA81_000302 [Batrachochytrium salamandrivorans]